MMFILSLYILLVTSWSVLIQGFTITVTSTTPTPSTTNMMTMMSIPYGRSYQRRRYLYGYKRNLQDGTCYGWNGRTLQTPTTLSFLSFKSTSTAWPRMMTRKMMTATTSSSNSEFVELELTSSPIFIHIQNQTLTFYNPPMIRSSSTTTNGSLHQRNITTTTTSAVAAAAAGVVTTVNDLLEMKPGEYVSTDIITVVHDHNNNNNHDGVIINNNNNNNKTTYMFRIHLYPFGPRQNNIGPTTTTTSNTLIPESQNTNGFGTLYAMELSKDYEWFQQQFLHSISFLRRAVEPNPMEKFQNYNVGLYLQFLPLSPEQSVDVSFTMRLLGGSSNSGSRHDISNDPPRDDDSSHHHDRRYALEWNAGMRFVAPSHPQCQLRYGQVNDFGTSLMRSYLISSFFATRTVVATDADADDNSNNDDHSNKIQVQLDLQVHERPNDQTHGQRNVQTNNQLWTFFPNASSLFTLRDIRYRNDDERNNSTLVEPERQSEQQQPHDIDEVRVGRVVVPICTKLSQRSKMFQLGIYPGVEYRIMRIHTPLNQQQQHQPLLQPMVSSGIENQNDYQDPQSQPQSQMQSGKSIDLFYSRPGAIYDLKPIYPLVKQLERPWPVTVYEYDIPKLCTPYQYNVISAIGSLFTAITGLVAAYIISQCISLYYIPSKSMDPTLQVGDVLLVEKISPKINQFYRPGDVVLFNPPTPLQDIVTRSGGNIDRRSLFVKRVAGVAGDRITVTPMGTVQITAPDGNERTNGKRDLCDTEPIGLIKKFLPNTIQETVLAPNTVEVLGDCSSVSIDSRVWGELPTHDIVGRPIVRLWPLSKFGQIPNLPYSIENNAKTERFK